MRNVNKIPVHIITTYFGSCSVLIRAENSEVILVGMYTDMLTGDCELINVLTDFETFNRLLAEAGEEQEGATDKIIATIAEELSKPVRSEGLIEVCGINELHFPNHIFSFTLLLVDDQEINSLQAEDAIYELNGFIPAGEYLSFYDLPSPGDDDEAKLSFYHKLLAVRYRFYLLHVKEMRHSKALQWANLSDPVVFRLAELQYWMGRSEK